MVLYSIWSLLLGSLQLRQIGFCHTLGPLRCAWSRLPSDMDFVPEMTYKVSSGTLSLYTLIQTWIPDSFIQDRDKTKTQYIRGQEKTTDAVVKKCS